MTSAATYRLPVPVGAHGPALPRLALNAMSTTVVIPVKDDYAGLEQTLRSLNRLSWRPCRVRVVDDGSQDAARIARITRAIRFKDLDVELMRFPNNLGPAAARNAGVRGLRGWVFFTDCACTHGADHLEQFACRYEQGDGRAVAIAGPVHFSGGGRIPRYMTEQGNLNPPFHDGRPQAIVTANALVRSDAAAAVGWFDETFREAGGEDFDLGLRLARLGPILWCPSARVVHSLPDDIQEFDARFARYGRGLRSLARKLGVDLAPYPFRAYSPDLQDLAERQLRMMSIGYRRASA